MSTQIPLRTARIPALQRQCLFLRLQYQNRALLNLSLRQTAGSPTTRAFSSTPQRPRRSKLSHDKAQTRAAYEFQVVPSPNVNLAKAQKSTESVTEDIGLLQNTIVRAPFSKLKGEGAVDIMKYFWEIFKHKASALYSRYSYRSCIQKTGWTRFFPVDLFNNAEYTSLAKKYYEQIFYNFAKGNITPIKQICLSPLAKKLESRIAARGPVQLEWQLHGPFKSSRVVSHRAAPLGAEQPDTAYRQVIVRLVSEQSLRAVPLSSTSSSSRRSIDRLPWVPDAARQQAEKRRQREVKHEAEDGIVDAAAEDQVAEEKAVPKTVVDYLVLQKRVIRGKEEDWKVWGFAEECTPEIIERDQEYWRRMLDATAAAGRF